jgi:hypothetical protein
LIALLTTTSPGVRDSIPMALKAAGECAVRLFCRYVRRYRRFHQQVRRRQFSCPRRPLKGSAGNAARGRRRSTVFLTIGATPRANGSGVKAQMSKTRQKFGLDSVTLKTRIACTH